MPECTCTLKNMANWDTGYEADWFINYCPLHLAAKAMYEALKSVEWAYDDHCPKCFSLVGDSHHGDCQLTVSLKQAEG